MIEQHALAPSVRAAVLAHYERAVDMIAANFPLAPVVPIYYPNGFDKDPHYGGSVHEPLPKTIPWVEIAEEPHPRRYVAVDANALLWLVHRGAVGFCSWTPSAHDPERVGCARIVLSPRGGATAEMVSAAMLALRVALIDRGVKAIPPRLKKQSDAVTEAWLPAYLAHRAGAPAPQGSMLQIGRAPAATIQIPRAVSQAAAAAVPLSSGSAAPAINPAARPIPDGWKTWIGANRLRGMADSTLVEIMARKGLDRGLAAAEVARSAKDPYFAVAQQAQQRLDKATALLAAISDLQGLHAAAGTIERRSGLSHRQFLDEYYSLNRPVILEGLMADWPAMHLWTPDYLKSRIGDEVVEVMADRNADPMFERNSQKHRREMRFGDYVDLVYGGDTTNEYYLVANNGFFQRPNVRVLLDDIRVFPEYLKPDNTGGIFLWFGPGGTLTPLHHDTSNIFMAQVSGRKRVRIVPSSQQPRLYNNVGVFSDVDPENPDFARHPEFRKATVIDLILEPGEVLFMPVGWWHHVRALDPSLMVSFTNFAFPNNFKWP